MENQPEKALGPEHPEVGQSLNNLAALYHGQGRYPETEPLYKRSLAVWETALGPDHPEVGNALNNLAMLAYTQSDWARATDYWRRSTGIISRRSERGLVVGQGEARLSTRQFWGLVKAAYRVAAQSATPSIAAEAFEAAQWFRGSEAAASLAEMAARSAMGSSNIANVVRERQDLARDWQASDKQLIVAKGAPPAERSVEAERVLVERIAVISDRLAEINRRLAQDFAEYAALASPAPVSLTEVQAQLRTNEALVLFLDTPEWNATPEETYVWFVTKSNVRWVRSKLGTEALARETAALRCGLDKTAWYGEGAKKCAMALDIPLAKSPNPHQALPFDHARAHRVYSALFGEAREMIKGMDLRVVPPARLRNFPSRCL